VLDNFGEGVLKPGIYDPVLNPLFRDMLAHYGGVALPCRLRNPDCEGRVKRSVGRAKNTPLKGLRFEKPRHIWIAGKRTGQLRASMAPPSARSRRCLPTRNWRCCRSRWNRSARASSATGARTWMAAPK
jgi:hypothetical protein